MTLEITLMLLILITTIILFITEVLRIDITALSIMVILPWLGLIEPLEAFSGLASNAVIAVIAVMVLGEGLVQTGAMQLLTRPILNLAGQEEQKLTAVISASAGVFSAFVQNIGVIALFLPVVRRIASKTNNSISKILLPVGFATLLGGSLTMVGSGNLIILNDLLVQGGESSFNLFSVTPIGAVLLLIGIAYFFVFGNRLLPARECEVEEDATRQKELIDNWNLVTTIYSSRVKKSSQLVGETLESAGLWSEYGIYLLALKEREDISYAPWRFTRFSSGQKLIILGREDSVAKFAADFGLNYVEEGRREESGQLTSGLDLQESFFAEFLVPPRSEYQGKTLREIALRKNFNINPLRLIRGNKELTGDFSDFKMRAGDIIVVFGLRENIKAAARTENFVSLTNFQSIKKPTGSPKLAIAIFLLSIVLILFGFELSLALFSGALAMVLAGLIPVQELYQAIDWQTVFLLTGLIPLGLAMEKTGTAEYLATNLMVILADAPTFTILLALASLSTLFTLFMSNVASTAVLVPLVIMIGNQSGINPRALALLVALCASNSFVLPTHQVNAFLMNPGNYNSRDYLKAGSILTLLYILLVSSMIYLFYL